MFPAAFNDRLGALGNKAEVELELITEILCRALTQADEQNLPHVRIVVDRLGGRRYYRELVEDLAQGAFVQVIEEGPMRSLYRYEAGGREVEIGFYVGGDGLHLPIALASMTAKYLRERCMRRFNAYWASFRPDLVPTAGYPGDSRRFLQDIEPLLADIALPLHRLWRER
jgi:ribonuclease HII